MTKYLNKFHKKLCEAGISHSESLVKISDSVRDRSDISVYQCKQSGVIILSNLEHISSQNYEAKENYSYWGTKSRSESLKITFSDDSRRFEAFKNYLQNKNWLDVGTGLGGILEIASSHGIKGDAVEPQPIPREALLESGFNTYLSIESIEEKCYDVATLFHVMEHLASPIETLTQLYNKMADSGTLIIEVPHAKDCLISRYQSKEFMEFTFWSEHLLLHTKESLRFFIEEAGFQIQHIYGIQRYGLANHLHWLSKGMPGGQNNWSEMNCLDKEYEKLLCSLNETDTLIAVAIK